jgi:N-acetylneuraminic acid mutarotase
MKKIFQAFLCVFVLITNGFSQTWVEKTNMPTAGRMSAISFTINGKAYVGLGRLTDGYTLNDLWEYVPASDSASKNDFRNHGSDTWIRKSDYTGIGLYASTSFSINGKGYVCLGGDNYGNGQSDLWEYNPILDSWTQKANFPGMPRYGASCFVIGDTAFIGTGSYNNPDDYLTDFWMYIPATDTWVQINDFPGGHRCHATAFSIGEYGYVGTGLADMYTATKDIWRYNKQNNLWMEVQVFPDSRMGTVSFVLNGKGYIGTGYDFANKLNDFYEYNPVTNWWTLLQMTGELPIRHAAVSFVLDNNFYVATGEADTPNTLNDLWTSNYITGNDDYKENNDIILFPNPSENELNVQVSGGLGITRLIIRDLGGQELLTQTITDNKAILDISNFTKGIYFVELSNKEFLKVRKIIKE